MTLRSCHGGDVKGVSCPWIQASDHNAAGVGAVGVDHQLCSGRVAGLNPVCEVRLVSLRV